MRKKCLSLGKIVAPQRVPSHIHALAYLLIALFDFVRDLAGVGGGIINLAVIPVVAAEDHIIVIVAENIIANIIGIIHIQIEQIRQRRRNAL